MGWAGMGLIIVSGITATVLRERRVPNAPGRRALSGDTSVRIGVFDNGQTSCNAAQ